MILFYDTETTGLPLWKEPSNHADQPHVVQLAMILVDPETRDVVNRKNLIVRPDGWTIPDEVVKIHGITNERAFAEGVPAKHAVNLFMAAQSMATMEAGFGVAFDRRMMRIAMMRHGLTREEVEAREIKPTEDVMRMATPICALPPTDKMMATGRKTFKSPTLTEVVRLLLGREFDGAHDAMNDIEATVELYWHLKDGKGLHQAAA